MRDYKYFRVWILFVIVLLLGIFFRFYNIGRKLYWSDEVHTHLKVGGYTTKEIAESIPENIMNVDNLKKYFHISSQFEFAKIINAFAKEYPEHIPFYYVLLKIWVKLFGDSISALRSLSAFISILAFFCIYWLCLELFKRKKIALVTVALVDI